ncbi:hypothetical protein GEZ71_05210 [Streptococcus mitis]|uniref:Uncharacterized protein n=1 Tax=Streptococcus mitis TaxID=28037 RepID=A0A7X1V351_STRMT|nr:hypothetical protein [Streptococcus mitis]MQQ50457.1 hypothetical protein [Streptococcus mitis]
MLGIVFHIIWAIINILLYPYVFSYIFKVVSNIIPKGFFFSFMFKQIGAAYREEMDKGDIYLKHRIYYDYRGYPTSIEPVYDRAIDRALDAVSGMFAIQFGIRIVCVSVGIVLLIATWYFTIFYGWFFAIKYNRQHPIKKKSQNEPVKMPSIQNVNQISEVQGSELDSESTISSDNRNQEISSQKRKVSDLLTQERVEKAGNILEKMLSILIRISIGFFKVLGKVVFFTLKVTRGIFRGIEHSVEDSIRRMF